VTVPYFVSPISSYFVPYFRSPISVPYFLFMLFMRPYLCPIYCPLSLTPQRRDCRVARGLAPRNDEKGITL